MKVEFNNQSIFVGDGGVQWREGLNTLVLLHGAGLNRTVWVLLGRYFARRGYNVVIPDLPGHGVSEGEAFDTIEQNAIWVNALLQHLIKGHPLDSQNAVYVGHSMGSLVMLEAAAQATLQHKDNSAEPNMPEVTRLMLLGSAAPMAVGEALLNAAKANDHAAIDMINMFGHSFSSRIGNNPVSGINVYNTMEALLESAAPGVLYKDLNACNDYMAGDAAARTLNGSVASTVIAGDADRMTPLRGGKALSEQLGGQLAVLKNCGHMMMSEQPEATLLAMKNAL